MTLQQLIHQAMINPTFRAALEAGTVDAGEISCTAHQIQAAATALRFNNTATRGEQRGKHLFDDLLGNNVFTLPGWRLAPEGTG